MRKLPYKVIGTYHPAEGATPEQIGHDLIKIVAEAGYSGLRNHGWSGATWHDNATGSEVRHDYIRDSSARVWHQDSMGADVLMVVWANKNPTWIKYKYGLKVYVPEPFEIVLIENARTKHHAPATADEADRLFFRQYVQVAESEPAEYDAEGMAS
jgi:hypothetical protein